MHYGIVSISTPARSVNEARSVFCSKLERRGTARSKRNPSIRNDSGTRKNQSREGRTIYPKRLCGQYQQNGSQKTATESV